MKTNVNLGLRASAEDQKRIDALVDAGRFISKSDLMRTAIRELLQREAAKA